MFIRVANPIYDSVFKYLVEDERIARTLLSALLKKDVVEVHPRRHEYTNGTRDKISMFRIDFGATVREADGAEHLVLIELQKTWLETETLRFRQYLGAHYSNPENIVKEGSGKGYALPTISVYLLGHRVGDIEEPVLYVNHKSYNYDGKEVTKGLPDPFVESLLHNSIIVQIPLLSQNIKNRLGRVLSVFDQSQRDAHNHQLLNVDEEQFAGDTDMQRIIHRLLAAASDAQLRQDMNVEDEYFSVIENRDTAIMNRDKIIKEQDVHIKEQDVHIKEQDVHIKEQDVYIKEQDVYIKEQDVHIKEQEAQLALQQERMRSMAKKLLGAGFALDEIARVTGFDVSELEAL